MQANTSSNIIDTKRFNTETYDSTLIEANLVLATRLSSSN